MNTRYELFYGTGGHAGPFIGLGNAISEAENRLRGTVVGTERSIRIRPYSAKGLGGYGPVCYIVVKNAEGVVSSWPAGEP